MQNKQTPQESINQFEQNMNKNALLDNVSVLQLNYAHKILYMQWLLYKIIKME